MERALRLRASLSTADFVLLEALAIASSRENSGWESFTVTVGMIKMVLPFAYKAIPKPTASRKEGDERAVEIYRVEGSTIVISGINLKSRTLRVTKLAP